MRSAKAVMFNASLRRTRKFLFRKSMSSFFDANISMDMFMGMTDGL